MSERQSKAGTIRITIADWMVDDGPSDEPQHATSVVAARCGVRVSTLRRYEEWGLVEPVRTGKQKLYSEADIDQVLRVRRLVDELGVNLAGAAAVLHLRQQVIALQREMRILREQLNR
jgi:MerR family transcriptional regulator/heat shock protein HspR